MSLKQSVVVVNKFSTFDNKTKTGSRGKTPGRYILRYMARDDATEMLSPIRRTVSDDFIMRYMARDEATEKLNIDDVGPMISPTWRTKVQKVVSNVAADGGVAFGYGSFSLSAQDLRNASNDIQHLFEEGHTAMITVLSFDEDYLRRNKLVEEDFVLHKAGDYRGNVDI